MGVLWVVELVQRSISSLLLEDGNASVRFCVFSSCSGDCSRRSRTTPLCLCIRKNRQTNLEGVMPALALTSGVCATHRSNTM